MNMDVSPFDRPVVSPVLVGRIQEMDMLERALHSAQRGAGQCIVIAGEAGVGKSRLLSEICRCAEVERFLILRGYCFEQDAAFPYAPLVDALRTHLARCVPVEIDERLGPFAPEIVKLLPEMALALPDLQPSPALDPEAEKRRLFESLIQFFIRLAARGPLLLILEDLHWSDKVSLDFLQLFVRRLPTQPILLLASYRQEEAPLPLTHLLAQFDRERLAREISLAPLTRPNVDLMLRAIFDLPHPVKTEFLDLLYPLTEGNPFFLEEVLKALIATREIYYTAGHWERKPIRELRVPRSVQDTVQRRTSQLSQAAQKVLTLAAVTGRRFDFALLQELTEIAAEELVPLVQQLIAAQLFIEESADQFAFRHALTREAVYAALLRRERKALHQKIAETLERVYAEALDAHAADLAYHSYAAGMWAKALTYSRRAGEHAQALFAPYEAIEQFTRALEAARQMSLPPPTEILRGRGQAYEMTGNFERARDDYEAALSAAKEAHDGPAEWQGLIDLGFLWTARDYAKTGEYFQRALELARALDEPATIGHSLNRLGNWYANVEQPEAGLRYHQEALELFQSRNDPRGLGETLDLLGMSSQLNSDLLQSHQFYQRAIALWRALSDRRGLASSLASLPLCAAIYLKNSDVPAISLAEATRWSEEAIQIAREIGWRAGEAYAELMLAMGLGPQGEYARALERAQSGLAVAEEIEHRQWISGAHAALGMLYLDLLALNAARPHLEQALALASALGSRVWVGLTSGYLASVYAAQGKLELAEATLNDVLESDTPMQTQSQRLCWYMRGELTLRRGKAETALYIAEELVASAANVTAETVIPRLWKLRGEALAALRRTAEAETMLRAARDEAQARGLPPLLWRIHIALGKLYQSLKRLDAAESEFAAARAVVEKLADTIPDQALRDNFIRQAGALMPPTAPPSPRRSAKKEFGGLTAREREVAAYIARGMSNRAIADILVVSERTVETHVSNILNRLGFTSRAQIAAWAVEKGLAKGTQQ
jgi:DNA-binding CsgD family transcriptional regulator